MSDDITPVPAQSAPTQTSVSTSAPTEAQKFHSLPGMQLRPSSSSIAPSTEGSDTAVKGDDAGYLIDDDPDFYTEPKSEPTSEPKSDHTIQNSEPEPKTEPELKSEPNSDTDAGKDPFTFDLPEEPTTEPTTEPQSQDDIPKGPRDYSAFKPEHVPYLKALNNKQFKEFAPQLLELYKVQAEAAQLKQDYERIKEGKLPDSYYEHPSSYVLDPRFSQLQQEIQLDDYEENFYRKQLALIRDGKEWTAITGWTNDGKPQYQKVAALPDGNIDRNAEARLEEYLGRLTSAKSQKYSTIQQLQAEHTYQYRQALQEAKLAEDKFFPTLRDPQKWSPAVKANIEKVTALIHPTFRQSPLALMLAKSFAVHVAKDSQLKALQAKVKALEGQISDIKKAGPSTTSFQGGSASKETILDISDWDD